MCMSCGQVGCCDSSKNKHAYRHADEASRPIGHVGEHALEWECARCIFLPTLTHFFGSDEAARCTRGYASEDPRPPQDRGVQRPGRQGCGPLRGKEYIVVDVRFADGRSTLFWPADLEEVDSPRRWWRSLLGKDDADY